MKRILFLDIDGVLNNGFADFSIESLSLIKRLIMENNAKVVMITSRQRSGTKVIRNKLANLMKNYDINGIDFIDPNYEGDLCGIPIASRALGIVDYLKNEENLEYVILDDEYNRDYRLLCLNYYRTYNGLKNKDYSHINFKKVNKNNFKHVNYHYRKLGQFEQASNNLIKVLKQAINK